MDDPDVYEETAPAAGESRGGPPYAACVQCQEPTEYPESTRGITLCPVCEWREAERAACSG
ncbi:hypothetical protein [Streptomyces ficellus]|uniref:Uncharacterized protein n=1 Tax=Streptomyces ficellus TaxID=1977088 RepID=A0A6I6F4Z0_9ACTN|nr:hypothetical protein [Streptomyces ficellus]QGV77961.1 hypothetical protein EIZ62_06615 [Streptomyces ficellus]